PAAATPLTSTMRLNCSSRRDAVPHTTWPCCPRRHAPALPTSTCPLVPTTSTTPRRWPPAIALPPSRPLLAVSLEPHLPALATSGHEPRKRPHTLLEPLAEHHERNHEHQALDELADPDRGDGGQRPRGVQEAAGALTQLSGHPSQFRPQGAGRHDAERTKVIV